MLDGTPPPSRRRPRAERKRPKKQKYLPHTILASACAMLLVVGVSSMVEADHPQVAALGLRRLTVSGSNANATLSCNDHPGEGGMPKPPPPNTGSVNGDVILDFAVVLYIFVGLAVICDEYFTPALERISTELGLSDDVAGATFLAAGSSAPELFTSFGDTFGPGNAIGVGTIVGSAMYNLLIIVAASATVAGKDLMIDFRPVMRDAGYYLSSIFLFALVAMDGTVQAFEAAIMVISYLSYIVFMTRNERLLFTCCGPPDGSNANTTEEALDTDEEEEEEVEEEYEPLAWPSNASCLIKILHLCFLPVTFAFYCTVPDVRLSKYHNMYWPSFVLCIVWVAILCFFMVEYGSHAGCLLGINPVVMGLLVLAVGTSVPDTLGSMAMARAGKADAAIANAIGSNVFDILLGLGLPWLMVIMIKGKTVTLANVEEDLMPAVVVLSLAIVFFVSILAVNRWMMNAASAFYMVFAYAVYVANVVMGATGLKSEALTVLCLSVIVAIVAVYRMRLGVRRAKAEERARRAALEGEGRSEGGIALAPAADGASAAIKFVPTEDNAPAVDDDGSVVGINGVKISV
jgi:K+-dependent Na+/Ca+ exchanger-like protein